METPGQIFKRPAQLDVELLNHLKTHVEMMNVDSAADELLASKIGKEPEKCLVATEMEPLTPQLRIIVRDKTHACRRCKCKFLNWREQQSHVRDFWFYSPSGSHFHVGISGNQSAEYESIFHGGR